MNELSKQRPGFHGELAVIRVDALPERLGPEQAREAGRLVVGHSETGHCHVITRPDVHMYSDPHDDFQAWLEVRGAKGVPDVAELIHEKDGPDAHGTAILPVGKYKIRRQREHTPEGYRAVAD